MEISLKKKHVGCWSLQTGPEESTKPHSIPGFSSRFWRCTKSDVWSISLRVPFNICLYLYIIYIYTDLCTHVYCFIQPQSSAGAPSHLIALPPKNHLFCDRASPRIPARGDAYEGQGERWLIPPALCLRTVQCHGYYHVGTGVGGDVDAWKVKAHMGFRSVLLTN